MNKVTFGKRMSIIATKQEVGIARVVQSGYRIALNVYDIWHANACIPIDMGSAFEWNEFGDYPWA